MPASDRTGFVTLDLNNPQFLDDLFSMQKPERHSAIETLSRLRRMTWDQVYQDQGLRWEKIASVKPPPGIPAIYSLRITQSRRATAYRAGDILVFLSLPPDHDSAYGRK